MARTLQDENFLTWEAYPSAGDFGFSTKPYITFNCLTDRLQRPRQHRIEGDEADAEQIIGSASEVELLEMLKNAPPVE